MFVNAPLVHKEAYPNHGGPEEVEVAEPVMRGMFSVYETAGGGYHIAYRQHGSAEETHIDIPGMVVRMARVVGAGKISISTEAMDGRPI